MSIEQIDLDKARALGGSVYNHSGQIITADNGWGHTQYYLGDDYDQYTAMDALVRTVLDHQDNWRMRGEIVKIEDDSDYLIVTLSQDDIDENDNDIKTESVEYIRYRWVDCETLVNTVSNKEITVTLKKAGALL